MPDSRTEAIVESVTIAAPASIIFAALTEPDQIPEWWGDENSFRILEVSSDLRPGGTFHMRGKNAGGGHQNVTGTYQIVEPPSTIEMSWRHDFAGPDVPQYDSIVRYDLVERNGETTVTVTHSGLQSDEERFGLGKGWRATLQWLAAHMRRNATTKEAAS